MGIQYPINHVPSLGKGSVLFERFSSGSPTGVLQHLGNCSKFELEPKDDKSELFQSLYPTPTMLAQAVKKRDIKVMVEGTDFSADHSQIYSLAGGVTSLAIAATAVSGETLISAAQTNNAKGRYFRVAKLEWDPAVAPVVTQTRGPRGRHGLCPGRCRARAHLHPVNERAGRHRHGRGHHLLHAAGPDALADLRPHREFRSGPHPVRSGSRGRAKHHVRRVAREPHAERQNWIDLGRVRELDPRGLGSRRYREPSDRAVLPVHVSLIFLPWFAAPKAAAKHAEGPGREARALAREPRTSAPGSARRHKDTSCKTNRSNWTAASFAAYPRISARPKTITSSPTSAAPARSNL